MATMVVIDLETFEREFEATADKLRGDKFEEQYMHPSKANSPGNLEQMHRKFHYELHLLKDRLKKA